jgi:hypothetical protein
MLKVKHGPEELSRMSWKINKEAKPQNNKRVKPKTRQ